MQQLFRTKRALTHAHSQWNRFAYVQPSNTQRSSVLARIKPHQIVTQDKDILVTMAGFVTMAIHVDRATFYRTLIVVPGIDCEGKQGYLVLREKAPPYHSIAETIPEACLEADRAQQKALALLAAYGDKNELRSAVRRAPWYQWITQDDLEASGLCIWGTESFLKQHYLLTLARIFGLPRLLLRFAGQYGDRAVAASILRSRTRQSNFGLKHKRTTNQVSDVQESEKTA